MPIGLKSDEAAFNLFVLFFVVPLEPEEERRRERHLLYLTASGAPQRPSVRIANDERRRS